MQLRLNKQLILTKTREGPLRPGNEKLTTKLLLRLTIPYG